MSIFISYSHADKDFVDRLAIKLVAKRIPVYVDRWELNIGDSITDKIQTAITEASYLIVVLSKNSVESNWCKRELNSGLGLELEQKRVMILPVLIEDCVIPLFLKDKLYADFRTSFEEGLDQIMKTVSNLTAEDKGRLHESENFYTDFTTSWGIRGEHFEFHIDTVDFSISSDKPYTIYSNIVFIGNNNATKKYEEYKAKGIEPLMQQIILMLCSEDKDISGMNAYLEQDSPFSTTFEIKDPINDISFQAFVTIKRLGVTDGKDKLYYFGSIFDKLWENAKNRKSSH